MNTYGIWYGGPKDRCTFVKGGAFEYLRRGEPFDVVLCLGFFYHTWQQPELLALIRRANPRYIVIDMHVATLDGNVALAHLDNVDSETDAVEDVSAYKGRVWVLAPSVPLLQALVRHFDFDVQMTDWQALLSDGNHAGVEAYARGRRVTLHGTSVPGSEAVRP